MAAEYAHGEILVDCAWVDEHRQDPTVRLVESNEDLLLYRQGHIPEAAHIDWTTDLNDQIVRDYIGRPAFEELCRSKGIANDTTVVLYGDKNNWWACYAFWVFKMYGHADCRIMNGGRKRWQLDGREMVKTPEPEYPRTEYTASGPDYTNRIFRDAVLEHQKAGRPLIDVRSRGEYTGELLHMEDYPQEGSLRGGHIRGAYNVPWSRAINEDGTFKSREELEAIYQGEAGLTPSDDLVVAYCRIGERSSHTWFVLKYLLGFPNVKNYDGSWTEWGNLVGVPIARGESPSGNA
jgi:thiosulfate/3-mercaptopyruvate sulfurtransferase